MRVDFAESSGICVGKFQFIEVHIEMSYSSVINYSYTRSLLKYGTKIRNKSKK